MKSSLYLPLLVAIYLTGCATQSTPLAGVPQVRLTIPTDLKTECSRPAPTDGTLGNLARLAIEDARALADCASKHAEIVKITNEYERLTK